MSIAIGPSTALKIYLGETEVNAVNYGGVQVFKRPTLPTITELALAPPEYRSEVGGAFTIAVSCTATNQTSLTVSAHWSDGHVDAIQLNPQGIGSLTGRPHDAVITATATNAEGSVSAKAQFFYTTDASASLQVSGGREIQHIFQAQIDATFGGHPVRSAVLQIGGRATIDLLRHHSDGSYSVAHSFGRNGTAYDVSVTLTVNAGLSDAAPLVRRAVVRVPE